jgi:5S rRNA maturation endonuclease (ribonuclease M5)
MQEVVEEEELPEVQLPKGYERVYFDEYLRDRNFKSYQYDQFEVGITKHFLERRLHNYLIFVLKQKGKIVGWLARSKYSKEWHKDNLEKSKLDECKLKLRYMNSTGTDFEKILGGFDEITENTHTVIAVEGMFDKTNISNLMQTRQSEDLKVIFTFGDKFSDHQIKLLRTTNVERVILMYDSNTIGQSKRYSMELSKYFDTQVCCIEDESVDPGNMTAEYLQKLLGNMKNFLYFYSSKIETKIKS